MHPGPLSENLQKIKKPNNQRTSWYPHMKIVLGGEEESEKNRVLLGPLREETRKLITLDACIALEGVRVVSAYTTELGPNELKFNEDDKRGKMSIVGSSRINLLDDDEKFTYTDVQLQRPSTIECGLEEKKESTRGSGLKQLEAFSKDQRKNELNWRLETKMV